MGSKWNIGRDVIRLMESVMEGEQNGEMCFV